MKCKLKEGPNPLRVQQDHYERYRFRDYIQEGNEYLQEQVTRLEESHRKNLDTIQEERKSHCEEVTALEGKNKKSLSIIQEENKSLREQVTALEETNNNPEGVLAASNAEAAKCRFLLQELRAACQRLEKERVATLRMIFNAIFSRGDVSKKEKRLHGVIFEAGERFNRVCGEAEKRMQEIHNAELVQMGECLPKQGERYQQVRGGVDRGEAQRTERTKAPLDTLQTSQAKNKGIHQNEETGEFWYWDFADRWVFRIWVFLLVAAVLWELTLILLDISG
jgi:hypothetical protein